MYCIVCFVYSSDGIYLGVGMITGSVAVYISFSLQVRPNTSLFVCTGFNVIISSEFLLHVKVH